MQVQGHYHVKILASFLPYLNRRIAQLLKGSGLHDLSVEEAVIPALVLPFYDPSGALLAQLTTITPTLREVFARVVLSASPPTELLIRLLLDRNELMHKE